MACRVAIVQAASVGFDKAATVEKAARWTGEAARGGAQLVVFPEAFVGGYPRGSTFGVIIGERTPEGREWFRRYAEGAVDAASPESADVAALGGIARSHRVFLVMGVIEREGGTLYCTVLFFGPDGSLLGKHRKLMPTAAERLIWGCGDGSTMPVLSTPIGRIGAAICWENYMPMYRMYLYSRGIQIYCAPTADPRDSWQASIRHIALEGRCFVLSANQFVRRADLPEGLASVKGPADEVICRGGSAIIDPLGHVLAGPAFDGETLLTADLDLDSIQRAQFDFDVTGHYARPDVFRLEVDERPRRAVVASRPPESLP